MKEQEYLDILTEQLRCKKAREAVAEEVKGHIEDQAEVYIAKGMPYDTAIEEAVKDMGDPVEAGVALDRVHRPKVTWPWMLFVVALNFLGILVVQILIPWSAGGYAYARGSQVPYVLLGAGVMLLVCYFDYTNIERYCIPLAVLFLLLMGVQVFFTGMQINGMTMYLSFPMFGGALSLWMLMFLYVPIYGALLYRFRGQGKRAVGKGILLALFPAVLAFHMPNISLGVGIFGILMVMLTIALMKNWYRVHGKRVALILWGSVVCMPAILLGILAGTHRLAEYQTTRIAAFIHPEQYAESAGYNYQILRNMMSGLRLFGKAPVNTEVMAERLTTGQGEYILTMLMAYYGIMAGFIVVMLLGVLVFWIFRISLKQKNQLGMMMGSGCGLVLGFWIIGYALQNIGVLPAATSYLPFFSFGGSGCVVTYVLVGIWLSVYRYQDVMPEKIPERRKLLNS